MDAIENLFSLDYPSIIMGVFIIILGVDKVIFLLTKVKKSLRIKFGYEEDKVIQLLRIRKSDYVIINQQFEKIQKDMIIGNTKRLLKCLKVLKILNLNY